MAFADAIFEKRTQRRKLSRYGTLLEAMVVQMTDEFTDHGMGDRMECGRLGPRRRKIRKKLVEVSSVVRNGMWRGISYRPQIFQILGNRCFHSTLDLPWQTRRYSIGTPNTLNSESTGVLSINAGGSGLGCHGHGNFLGGRLRRCFRDQFFPVATFLETGVNGADFGALLDDERRPALWTRLGDGHVRRRKSAIRIARAAVKNARASTATLACTAAADELDEAAVFFHETVAAERALFVQRLIGLVRDARALNQTAGGPAIRVTRASEERAEAAALNGHLLAAIVAIFGFGFAAGFFRKFRRKVLNEIAVGIPRAAEEEAMAADSLQQLALAAFFALLTRGDARFVREHLVAGLVEINDEFLPEFFDGFAPGQLAFLDLVELFFEPRGKRHVENVFKALHQQGADAFAKHGGREASLILGNVFTLNDRRNDRSISRGPPDAVFFELFDQGGIVEPRRRLGKMLIRTNLVQAEDLPFHNLRQRPALSFVILLVVIAVGVRRGQLIDAEVAVEFLDRTGGTERVVSGIDVDGGLIENRREHL